MRRILILVVLGLSILVATASSASAIVHTFTPSNECGSAGVSEGGSRAFPVISQRFMPPVPEDASDGRTQGKAPVPDAC